MTTDVKRSIAKAITYRAMSTMVNMIMMRMASGSWHAAVGFALADVVVHFGTYYVHERAWAHVPYGRNGSDTLDVSVHYHHNPT